MIKRLFMFVVNIIINVIIYECLPKYVHSNGLKLSGAFEKLSITSLFLGSKMQKSTF